MENNVLILVLVEYTVTKKMSYWTNRDFVLILVLVEYTVTSFQGQTNGILKRLNPCFSGIYCDWTKTFNL